MTTYDYSVANDTANGKVDCVALDYALRRSNPPMVSSALMKISQNHDVLSIEYEGDLDAGDQATLSAAVAAHQGLPVPMSVVIQTAHITNAETVPATVWMDVGGVVTRPEAFGPLPQLSVRLTLAVLVPVGGLDLQLMERDEDATERLLQSWSEADTLGAWRFLELDAVGATPGTHEYMLQAKLGAGGPNAEIRSASLTLIKTEGS